MNVIGLEFEFVYFEAAVQLFRIENIYLKWYNCVHYLY